MFISVKNHMNVKKSTVNSGRYLNNISKLFEMAASQTLVTDASSSLLKFDGLDHLPSRH